MTWVIGASSIMGSGVLISDVRVTFSDGQQCDLVKKAYPVGPFIGAGFAGSVRIGFQLLQSLCDFLILPEDAEKPAAWKPEWVAEHWAPLAAQIFDHASPREKKSHSQILMVGVSPDKNRGVPEIPSVMLVKFADPDFVPVITDKALAVCHIGSGAALSHYTKIMGSFFEFTSDALQFESAGPTGWPAMLGQSMGQLVAENPVDGISPHAHVLVCRTHEILELKNDRQTFVPGNPTPISRKMPPVAKSYAEFVKRCANLRFAAEGAVA